MSNNEITDDILMMSDDEIFLIAERCGWDKADARKSQMTSFDRVVWCNQMRAFVMEVREARLAISPDIRINDIARRQNAYKMTTVQNEYLAPEACGWRRDAIDLVAKQFAKALGFSCGDDIEPIVGQLGGKIEYEDFSLDEAAVAGWIEVDGVRNFKIRLNNEANSARDRFTIAHEIGHYVLHYLFALEKRGQFKLSANLTAQSEEGVSNPENEANYFALAFLMPSEEFGDYYNSVKNSPNGSLELTASKFGVPTWAAEFRAKSMSLI